MIDKKRLTSTFCDLLKINSPSKCEKPVAEYIKKIFGRKVVLSEDNTGSRIGGDCGNLFLSFRSPSKSDKKPLIFLSHLDTVAPTEGISVKYKNGTFSTDGRTILGADDKAGAAAMIELANVIQESALLERDVHFIFTVAEEIGLLGAKYLNLNKISKGYCFILDSTAHVGTVITNAPTLYRINITVSGRAAHSGVEPEKGINALTLASEAISKIKVGRINSATTANFGKISGGEATNIVPHNVIIEGEVRSLNKNDIARKVSEIKKTFANTARKYGGRVKFEEHTEFKGFNLDDDSIIDFCKFAANTAGIPFCTGSSGGGSDANVLNEKGIKSVVLGLGINGAHTHHESVRADDLIKLTEFILALTQH